MGNFNPNYFDRKSGSLERAVLDAVNGVKTQINEKKIIELEFKDKQSVGKEDGDIDNDGDKDASDKYKVQDVKKFLLKKSWKIAESCS